MPSIKCVEPAAETESKKSVVEARPGSDTEIIFPHIDSCLGVAFIMQSGGFIGGHVGMQNPGQPDPKPCANAVKICNNMLGLAGGNQIQCLILVGGDTWIDNLWEGGAPGTTNVVRALINLTNCNHSFFANTRNFPTGVDLYLNPRRKMAFIKEFKVNKCFALQLPFASVRAHTSKVIVNR